MPYFRPKLPELPPLDFGGQTAIITGTTNGLGLTASEELLRRRLSRLIMGVRTVSRGEEVKRQLLSDESIRAANPGAQIDVLELNLEDYSSVVAFADKVRSLTQTLDIAVLNAGMGTVYFEMSRSGHEKQMQVNLLSNALLALELLPLLEETAKAKGRPSRLTWVGSFVQFDSSIPKALPPNDTTLL